MENTEKTIHDIHEEALRTSEATVYTMKNRHTTTEEKFEIECWYQLPMDTAGWAFLINCIFWSYGVFTWWQAYSIAAGFGIFTAIIAWLFYSKRTIYIVSAILGFPIVRWIIPLGISGWLWLNGSSTQALFVMVNLVLLSFPVFIPSMVVNHILAGKYNIHPKYALLKHVYGKKYSFELI